jgi:hypothetical protein
VIDRGERLPRTSTFFWPKPRTGLVLRPLDLDATEVGSLDRLELLDAGGDHLGEAASPGSAPVSDRLSSRGRSKNALVQWGGARTKGGPRIFRTRFLTARAVDCPRSPQCT